MCLRALSCCLLARQNLGGASCFVRSQRSNTIWLSGKRGLEALVLVQITATKVALLDPALEDGPTLLSKDGFLLAWEEFDCLAAVISK
jgi:hypothetical protein